MDIWIVCVGGSPSAPGLPGREGSTSLLAAGLRSTWGDLPNACPGPAAASLCGCQKVLVQAWQGAVSLGPSLVDLRYGQVGCLGEGRRDECCPLLLGGCRDEHVM